MSAESTMRGKICLVSGATSGIGLVTAAELARRGAQVVLIGRNPSKTDAVVARIQAETGNKDVEALIADLSSQAQVRELARQFREKHPRLHVLINNAGGIWMKRELSADNIEMTVAVNHLACFLLTHRLLDTLKASAPARIVNVASAAHRGATMDFDDLMGDHRYGGWRQYCRSKLMNLLFTYELSRKLAGSNVTVNALHPGWVSTGFARDNGWKGRLIQIAARCLALSPEKGARTVLYLATSPDVAGLSGRYFAREQARTSSPASYDEVVARRLWQVSMDLTKLAADAPHIC